MTDWKVEYRPGGWARARGDGLTAYLRLGRDSDRRMQLRVYQMTLVSDQPLTESALRRVPLAEIEMHLAVLSSVTLASITPGEHADIPAEAIMQAGEIDGYDPEALERYFDTTRPLTLGGTIPDRLTLSKPPDGRITDEFLRELAAMYLGEVKANRPPGPAIAAAAGVPVRTVHRWVAEARSRGILPPATRGKAG